MKLSLEYLKERHNYWREEIGRAGIWDPGLFKNVEFEIRGAHRRYNAAFQRKFIVTFNTKKYHDRIIIYNGKIDFEIGFLDSVLIHEMIHQYIIQCDLQDSSTHGKIFKDFMKKINHVFEGRLQVNIKDNNPSIPQYGQGKESHHLLLISMENLWYCCLIHPAKLKEFNKQVKSLKKAGKISDYVWYQSNDISFNRRTRCLKHLKGEKLTNTEIKDFLKKVNAYKL